MSYLLAQRIGRFHFCQPALWIYTLKTINTQVKFPALLSVIFKGLCFSASPHVHEASLYHSRQLTGVNGGGNTERADKVLFSPFPLLWGGCGGVLFVAVHCVAVYCTMPVCLFFPPLLHICQAGKKCVVSVGVAAKGFAPRKKTETKK